MLNRGNFLFLKRQTYSPLTDEMISTYAQLEKKKQNNKASSEPPSKIFNQILENKVKIQTGVATASLNFSDNILFSQIQSEFPPTALFAPANFHFFPICDKTTF